MMERERERESREWRERVRTREDSEPTSTSPEQVASQQIVAEIFNFLIKQSVTQVL